jgi:hypothetical protein
MAISVNDAAEAQHHEGRDVIVMKDVTLSSDPMRRATLLIQTEPANDECPRWLLRGTKCMRT